MGRVCPTQSCPVSVARRYLATSLLSLLVVGCSSHPAPDAAATDTGPHSKIAPTPAKPPVPAGVRAPGKAQPQPAPKSVPQRVPWPPTGLALSLMATLAGESGDARATIRDGDSGTVATYRPGDKIRDGVEVLAVEEGVVELDHDGEVEYLSMSSGTLELSATDAFYPDLIDDLTLADDMSDAIVMPDGVEYTVKTRGTAWGTPRTISRLREAIRAYARAVDHEPKVHIGDLSLREGGPFPPHVSHRGGRDVDIGYVLTGPQADDRRFRSAHAANLDVERTWALLEALLDTKAVKYVFVDYEIQRLLYDHVVATEGDAVADRLLQFPRGRRASHGVLRHWKGHRNHFHVRFER